MFGSRHDCLSHISILEFHNPSSALLTGDAPTSAIESAVWHTFLFASIKNHSNAVSFAVLMHHSCDIQSTSLSFATLEDIASSLALTLASLHGCHPLCSLEQPADLPDPFKRADAP
jgi:hypothetical protein